MSCWSSFQSQFRETTWERQERQRNRRIKLRAEGRCWQCGALVEDCVCPNISHNRTRVAAKSNSKELPE